MDQNVSDAMSIVFGVGVFIIAVSLTMYLFNALTTSSTSIFDILGMPKYNLNVSLSSNTNEDVIDKDLREFDVRTVKKSTIIPMLNRYYKENFTVKLYDKSGKLMQVFDLGLEGEVARISGLSDKSKKNSRISASNLTPYEEKVKSTFGNEKHHLYMFTAPWRSAALKEKKDEFAKRRVEMYVNGFKSAINNIVVDYSENSSIKDRHWFAGLPDNTEFTETVVKYQTSGDVRLNTSDEYGEDLVEGLQGTDKIEIIYKEKEK